MAVLARAPLAELERLLAGVGPLPQYEIVKRPQIGTVMIEGRAGGDGRRFNLGEATVTHAVVQLDGGTLGFSYALGRDTKKAVLAAVLDAMLQDRATAAALQANVITPLAEVQQQRRLTRSRKAAATKVDFFTLMRERQ